MMMPEISPEEWIAKLKTGYADYQDVFLAYSAAMFAAQPLEAFLENILEGLRKLGLVEFTDMKWEWESVFESRLTLGKLVEKFREFAIVAYGDKEAKKLVKALNACAAHRNWLAHKYFREVHKSLDVPSEREKLIVKLAEVTIELTEVGNYLQEWSSFLARHLSKPGEYEDRLKAAGLVDDPT